ncbi:30S ribosomal protein S2 [candidate division Kazan bacterium RIFCSPHIGHO2_01_FULL_44_14]|uniref:Small ribosomal subunit protein uS2 n=1 Tax=candidate division Kazan bacterium RIFCSPLOWO2_01_FULL_45_19 TaxID=1798538 RepID=A0A1F4NRC7_UNCK3|nr:MAG: 30S ribosomal protein S2 [candidate division Kazan bacterium RIFCSPLOWO2_01_FULL_45_19]OGB78053.1 MAG: 30S ribosomal protein S2 [candidate division Kazan bacterium RIFCSPHIGHO2_01_FULL_44_14]
MAQSKISVETMMEAGMHFGHQTHRRNPKMDPYIFDVRSGIHIIDLTKTEPLLKSAMEFLKETVKGGRQVIIVGTKRQASALVKAQAEACGMPYVSERWLGGLLTNFETIKKRLKYLNELEIKLAQPDLGEMTKKEKVMLDRQLKALLTSLGGVKHLQGLPGAVFVIDLIKDKIAVKEASKLGIPVVALVDTNANPDTVDYPIPSNDDAKKAIEYVLELVAEACTVKPVAKAIEAKADKSANGSDKVSGDEPIVTDNETTGETLVIKEE